MDRGHECHCTVGSSSTLGGVLTGCLHAGGYEQPETLLRFVGRFPEPALLVWSDLLADLSADTALDDNAVWERKRAEFLNLLGRYQALLHFDAR